MRGKKAFILFVVLMLLLIAFGLWVVVKGDSQYKNRRRMESLLPRSAPFVQVL